MFPIFRFSSSLRNRGRRQRWRRENKIFSNDEKRPLKRGKCAAGDVSWIFKNFSRTLVALSKGIYPDFPIVFPASTTTAVYEQEIELTHDGSIISVPTEKLLPDWLQRFFVALVAIIRSICPKISPFIYATVPNWAIVVNAAGYKHYALHISLLFIIIIPRYSFLRATKFRFLSLSPSPYRHYLRFSK